MQNLFTLNRPLGRMHPARWGRALALLALLLMAGTSAHAQAPSWQAAMVLDQLPAGTRR